MKYNRPKLNNRNKLNNSCFSGLSAEASFECVSGASVGDLTCLPGTGARSCNTGTGAYDNCAIGTGIHDGCVSGGDISGS
ncbi:MAG: hypothetical protein ABIA04_13845 [Pseudomonadota bacterium]